MAHLMNQLEQAGKLRHVPPYVREPQYLTIMGSEAYGVTNGSSDFDVYGFCVPPKTMIFPHLAGEISGFGKPAQRFEQWQEHHIQFNDREYDIQIYGIVKYFDLLLNNNPNMVDSLFTPDRCVLHSSKISMLLRANRKKFLHKGSYHKFRGYAHNQLNKLRNKKPEGKRKQIVEQFGFDVKFAYHVIRLSDECEQILLFGDLDLERAKEMMRAVRNGQMPLEEIEKWFYEKERQLEKLYHESEAVPYSPDEEGIKVLLLNCLEEYYGSLDRSEIVVDKATDVLKQIKELIHNSGL